MEILFVLRCFNVAVGSWQSSNFGGGKGLSARKRVQKRERLGEIMRD